MLIMNVQNVVCGNYALRNENTKAGLGLVRGYLTSIGAASRNKIVSNSSVSEIDSVFPSYLFRRLFSTGTPKKGSKIRFVYGMLIAFLFVLFMV